MWYFNKLIMALVELFFFTCSKSEQIRCFISKDYEPIYIAGSKNGAQMNTLKTCYAKVSITEINEWSKTYKNCTQAYTLFEWTHKYMFFSFFVHRLNIFCEQRADGRLHVCISAFWCGWVHSNCGFKEVSLGRKGPCQWPARLHEIWGREAKSRNSTVIR